MKHILWLFAGSILFAAFITIMGADVGRLVEFSYTHEQVYGKYVSEDLGEDKLYGIVFVSRSDDYLLIRTSDGNTLVNASSITGIEKLRSIYIMGHKYLQYENSIHSDQPVDHDEPLSNAIIELLSLQECGLLEKAADAVGKKGLNGRNTPAALPFFVFALRITQLAEDSHYNNITATQRYRRNSYMHCRSTCPPCPNDECIGLCGKECSCWKWLCGDCCWHEGCYGHDLCCKKSWLQHHCLLPIKFSCDRPFKC